jgi:D-alanyl-D-alanine dipeptidase
MPIGSLLRAAALAAGLSTAEGPAAAPASEPLVEVTPLIADAVLDVRYATPNNFLGRAVYPAARCLLRRSVAERLVTAAAGLRERGFRLRLYDCYRPLRVQWEMWKLVPKPGYVADPRTGSNHNRGAAVDLSLADAAGAEVEMPTPYDSFEPRAHANARKGVSAAARRHRAILREAMERAGFTVNPKEWWHYDAPDPKRFPVMDEPLEPAARGP